MRKRTSRFILPFILMLCVVLCAVSAAAETNAAAVPEIALIYVPAYGDGHPFEGVVFTEDGSAFDTNAYRVTLYVGGFYPKPTYDEPSVPLDEDGFFSLNYCTGGENDKKSPFLELMLLPADFDQKHATRDQTRDAALDYVEVRRTADGAVTVLPERQAPATAVQSAPALPSGLLPVAWERIAVDVGFYTADGSSPGSALSEEQIRRQLTAVSAYADAVRFYAASGELAKAYGIARDMGFTVLGNAYLSKDKTANQAELDALIRHCNNGDCQVAIVGSEVLQRGDLTAGELVRAVRYVRERLTDQTIPVTVADSAWCLLACPAVRNACNFLMANCYPFWNSSPIEEAAERFIAEMDALADVSGGKEIVVSETGWPTAGQGKNTTAVTGEAEAAAYYSALRQWSLSTNTQVLYFEAADEPWKAADEGTAGAHWGFMTTDFQLKPCFEDLNPFYPDGIALSSDSFIYNGAVQRPTVSVKGITGETLTEGTDYTVAYSSGSKAPGTYTATVTLKGGYTGAVTKSYTINKQPLDASRVTLSWTSKAYNGAVQQPTVTVKNAAGYAMTENTSYTVSYAAESKIPGSYTVTVTGKGYYTGAVTKTYTIGKQPLDASRVTLSWTNKAYSGTVQKPTVTVKNARGYTMTENTSYTVSYSASSKNPGTYRVTVTGAGAYSGRVSKTYTITPQPLDESRVTLSWTSAPYNGAVQRPTVTVKNARGYTMTEGSSYTVAYSTSSKNPGTYRVTVTASGAAYSGSVSKTYRIVPQPLDESRVTLSWTSAPYNGAVQRPTVTVKNARGYTMTEGSSYTVSYSADSKIPGAYQVMVTAAGAAYTGSVTKTYTITKQQLDASRVTLSATGYTYDGKVHKPTVTVKNAAGYTMTLNTSYTVTCSGDCKTKGTYTVTVTGKGYYAGTVTKTFTIQ